MRSTHKPVAYFTLAIGQHGCLPDGHFGPFAISTRRELVAALQDAVAFWELPKSVLKGISISRTWQHAKRHGLSSVSLELATPSMRDCLMFMGLTEEEFEQHNQED